MKMFQIQKNEMLAFFQTKTKYFDIFNEPFNFKMSQFLSPFGTQKKIGEAFYKPEILFFGQLKQQYMLLRL